MDAAMLRRTPMATGTTHQRAIKLCASTGVTASGHANRYV